MNADEALLNETLVQMVADGRATATFEGQILSTDALREVLATERGDVVMFELHKAPEEAN